MKDLEIVSQFFDRRAREFGDSIETLDWGSKRTQAIRFNVLQEIGNLQHKKILDVGCGLAGFYCYLQEKSLDFQYTGVDLSKEIVEITRKKYPSLDIRLANILDEDLGIYDYVFGSGIHYIKVEDNYNLTTRLLQRMYASSRLGVATNFISDYFRHKIDRDYVFCFSPEKVFSLCKAFAPYVVLRHDYLPNDFTVYLYHQDWGVRNGFDERDQSC